MKVELHEIVFLQEAMNHVTIKAADAPEVAKLIGKMHNEKTRLQKLQAKQ